MGRLRNRDEGDGCGRHHELRRDAFEQHSRHDRRRLARTQDVARQGFLLGRLRPHGRARSLEYGRPHSDGQGRRRELQGFRRNLRLRQAGRLQERHRLGALPRDAGNRQSRRSRCRALRKRDDHGRTRPRSDGSGQDPCLRLRRDASHLHGSRSRSARSHDRRGDGLPRAHRALLLPRSDRSRRRGQGPRRQREFRELPALSPSRDGRTRRDRTEGEVLASDPRPQAPRTHVGAPRRRPHRDARLGPFPLHDRPQVRSQRLQGLGRHQRGAELRRRDVRRSGSEARDLPGNALARPLDERGAPLPSRREGRNRGGLRRRPRRHRPEPLLHARSQGSSLQEPLQRL